MPKLLENAHRLPVINWNYTFFGAHLQDVAENWSWPKEKHAAFELIYVIKGIEGIDYGVYSDRLKQGDFAIISPGTQHRVWSIQHLTYFCFHFDLDEPTFEEHLIANSKVVYHKDEKVNKIVTPQFQQMISLISPENLETYNFIDKMKIQILLSDIILSLYKGIELPYHPGNISTMQYAKMIRVHIKKSLRQQVDQAINDPKQAIQLHSSSLISDICQQLNLSVGYASKIFKKYYGSSPKSYLSDIKKEIAQQLLLKPQFDINQISQLLGYKNPANFSRQFKIWTGMSPRQFRIRKVSHFVDQRLFSENFPTFPKDKMNDSQFKKDFWNSI